jgi:hypothetical protein
MQEILHDDLIPPVDPAGDLRTARLWKSFAPSCRPCRIGHAANQFAPPPLAGSRTIVSVNVATTMLALRIQNILRDLPIRRQVKPLRCAQASFHLKLQRQKIPVTERAIGPEASVSVPT